VWRHIVIAHGGAGAEKGGRLIDRLNGKNVLTGIVQRECQGATQGLEMIAAATSRRAEVDIIGARGRRMRRSATSRSPRAVYASGSLRAYYLAAAHGHLIRASTGMAGEGHQQKRKNGKGMAQANAFGEHPQGAGQKARR
jgi:hypothetical protein